MSDAPGRWQGELDRRDLVEANAPADPLVLFGDWYALALEGAMVEPTAMTLATVDASGRPSARIVLLKGFDENGFRFYTNYRSRKGEALAAHPLAALVFWWESLERQIRVEGQVHKVDARLSNDYFARRSRASRLGAHASPQSRVIAGRDELEQRVADVENRFVDREVERPDHWGGYALKPEMIEFWQARRSRLHDRLRYQRSGERRQIDRLAP